MASLAQKPYYIVERRGTDLNGWYQTMMSPFKTFEECLEDIKRNYQYYPPEHQNYRITYEA